MLNLLRKDIILHKQMFVILLPILLVYLFLGASHILVGFVFSTVMVMTSFAMDEKSEINMLLNSLPYTRNEIVSSKYLGVFVLTFIVVVTIFIGNIIFNQELIPFIDIFFIFIIVMMFAAVLLPFSYKFKSQYLLIASIVLFLVYMVVVNFLIRNLNDIIREFIQRLLSAQNMMVYLFITVIIGGIYAGSWILSTHIYRKKLF
ncbi:ABC-2 transporter permease [Metabacillus malikii]|uniref:ABC-type transport system involved in multi-copper enzyme maturation permease subunit n=1 Tax=Metabacillus malikii TaxID=1504265 RepID=A0ABT9ZB60_9BACI|nr:ABC-2 transporter permease [Metabacillus malikii]MDQ0229144.1 ABC-type transport system involved in multi-copper enzyme maturation permease subunit [Metabacillus malikii]